VAIIASGIVDEHGDWAQRIADATDRGASSTTSFLVRVRRDLSPEREVHETQSRMRWGDLLFSVREKCWCDRLARS
ncbi:MAG: hypothetical protein AAFU50_05170, partial [Pseudomonadota bacterium]